MKMAAAEIKQIGAVLLSAGASRRFGIENKLLASVRGKCLIAHVAEEIAASLVTEIVVVTGSDQERLELVLKRFPVRFVHNANWRRGMSSSIGVGVRALGAHISGAFVVPGDMPLLRAAIFTKLVDRFVETGSEKIVFPVTPEGEQRNPVLWPRHLFADLASLRGVKGAKPLLQRLSSLTVPLVFEDASHFVDVDTANDLTAVCDHLRRSIKTKVEA